ncbi:hypothetical protein BCR34DRAFT_582674 [Clohesyomyces aquaticus]|uniref:NAD(P)-binding protein n=1 Tax=Clohesyomyces aquaticus TaxID=1231657 RepID=A0A1Y2A893_9PLEO|nr:hypothetical protein BCR34DRAFT_582674 [Clohesyomyces aquaticus]
MPSYVIVGASRGIGYQYLKTLSADPSNIVIGTARTVAPTAAQVASDKLGPNVHIIQGDLDSFSSLSAAAKATSLLTNGVVDYLIVNGAYLSKASQFKLPTDYATDPELFATELNNSMQTNVTGVLYAINAFLPLIRKSSIKKVIVITSGMADTDLVVPTPIKNALPYSISKVAVNMVVAKFAAELIDEGIAFLSLSPGLVDTDAGRADENATEEEKEMTAKLMEEFGKNLQKYSPTFAGPITTEESVRMMLEVVHGLTMKDTGAFLSHKGDKIWV